MQPRETEICVPVCFQTVSSSEQLSLNVLLILLWVGVWVETSHGLVQPA